MITINIPFQQHISIINTYIKVAQTKTNILHEYKKIIKETQGNVLILGVNNIIQEFSIYNCKKNIVKKKIFLLKYFIFSKKKILLKFTLNYNLNIYEKIYYRHSQYVKSCHVNIIMYSNILIYYNLLRNNFFINTYLINKSQSLKCIINFIKNYYTKNYFLKKTYLTIIYLNTYEFNICILKQGQIIFYDILYYKTIVNIDEFIGYLYQTHCNQNIIFPYIIVISKQKMFGILKNKLLALMITDILYINSLKFKYNLNWILYTFPMTYIKLFLKHEIKEGVFINKNKLILNKLIKLQKTNIKEQLYFYIIILFFIYIVIFFYKNIKYIYMFSLINNFCLTEIIYIVR